MSLADLARRLSERFELETLVVFRGREVVFRSGRGDVRQLSELVSCVRKLLNLSQVLELTRPSTVRLLAGNKVVLVMESGDEILIAIARAQDTAVIENVEVTLRRHLGEL